MIMEVTEAIGKTARVCVSACVKGTFLCLPQKHGIKIASLISPARHKNNMQRRERKGKGENKTKKTKNGTQAKKRDNKESFSATFSNVAPDFALHRSFTMSRPLRCYFWLPVCGSGSLRFHASVKIGWGFGSNQIGHKHPQHHLLGKGSGVKGRTLYSDKWIFNLLNCWLTPL